MEKARICCICIISGRLQQKNIHKKEWNLIKERHFQEQDTRGTAVPWTPPRRAISSSRMEALRMNSTAFLCVIMVKSMSLHWRILSPKRRPARAAGPAASMAVTQMPYKKSSPFWCKLSFLDIKYKVTLTLSVKLCGDWRKS